jgi:hypothetical protein
MVWVWTPQLHLSYHYVCCFKMLCREEEELSRSLLIEKTTLRFAWFINGGLNQCWTGIKVALGYQPGYQYEYENTQPVGYGLLIILRLRSYYHGMWKLDTWLISNLIGNNILSTLIYIHTQLFMNINAMVWVSTFLGCKVWVVNYKLCCSSAWQEAVTLWPRAALQCERHGAKIELGNLML